MRAKMFEVAGLSPSQMADVKRWSDRLTAEERRSLEVAVRPRLEARFVEPGAEDADAAADDFYEYVVNHELCFYEGRTFRICSAHAEARAAVSAGRIPATFRCPRAALDCPMRTLLDEVSGHDVRLVRGRVERSERSVAACGVAEALRELPVEVEETAHLSLHLADAVDEDRRA